MTKKLDATEQKQHMSKAPKETFVPREDETVLALYATVTTHTLSSCSCNYHQSGVDHDHMNIHESLALS